MRDADQGPGVVEQVDKQKNEDNSRDADIERAAQIEREKGRREARRRVDHSGEGRNAEQDAGERGGQDRDDDGARHRQTVERDHDDKAGAGQQRRRALQIAKRHQRIGVGGDDSGFFQRNDAEEQADAGGDRHLLRERDRIDNPGADARQTEDQKQDTGDENRARAPPASCSAALLRRYRRNRRSSPCPARAPADNSRRAPSAQSRRRRRGRSRQRRRRDPSPRRSRSAG